MAALGAALEHGCRSRQRLERPVVVCRRIDRPLIDDIADDHVAVGVGSDEDQFIGCDLRELATTTSTIIIRHDDEFLNWINRFSVKLQVGYAVRIFIDQLAVLVETNRLRQVDLVGHAIDDIVIVGRETVVQQRRILGAPP